MEILSFILIRYFAGFDTNTTSYILRNTQRKTLYFKYMSSHQNMAVKVILNSASDSLDRYTKYDWQLDFTNQTLIHKQIF